MLIFFGRLVNENSSTVLIFNVEDKNSTKDSDKVFFKNLCETTLEMESTPEVELTRVPIKTSKYFKPIKVSFATIWEKRKFLSLLFKLKSDENTKKIRVAHDMCLEDREENKKLLDQAYQKNITENPTKFRYKVRGPPWEQKIVKVHQKN